MIEYNVYVVNLEVLDASGKVVAKTNVNGSMESPKLVRFGLLAGARAVIEGLGHSTSDYKFNANIEEFKEETITPKCPICGDDMEDSFKSHCNGEVMCLECVYKKEKKND